MIRRHVVSLCAIAILAGGVTAPAVSNALTTPDVQTQINALLEKVRVLTQQLNELRGNASSGGAVVIPSVGVALPDAATKHRVCTSLERNLILGYRGDDVRALQEFLRENGYLNAEATGYYGRLTEDAVKKWQSAEGVVSSGASASTGWGRVGPATRDRLKVWCGGSHAPQQLSASPTRGNAPLTVSFSTWLSGFRINTISYVIDYGDGSSEKAADCPAPADACVSPGINTHTYTQNGTYIATLNKITDPCAGQPACRAAIQKEVIGKIEIVVGPIACTKEYKPVCGAKPIVCITTPCDPIPTTYGNACMMNADGASLLYEGECRAETTNPADNPQCKAWFDGCNSCSRSEPGGLAACTLKYCFAPGKAYCTDYFNSSTNKPPVISGFSGPTVVTAGTSGTWEIKASDPENQSLSYQVIWGDEKAYASAQAAGTPSFTQTTSFTHTYASPGVYYITIIVRDAAGKEAKTTTTVKVESEAVACTLEYAPVCGRPTGCANTCPPGQFCAAVCQLHSPVTYGNSCQLKAAGAQFLHSGECTAASGSVY